VALFVDTGAWYAISVASDPDHSAAIRFMRANTERLVTTDFIYDELLTLFRARGIVDPAKDWITQLNDARFEVIWVTADDLKKATTIYFQYSDKQWSFTDCTSLVVMQRLGIERAFAFDDHFRQFGNVTVLP